MTRTRTIAAATFAAFVATVAVANWLTTSYGSVPVGFGYVATAGTYAAGLAFVLRDTLHDTGGRRAVAVAVLVGAALSFAVAAPAIAVASAAAFALSELADWCVYVPLRQRGYVRAAIASNVVGTVVDSIVFLTIAGFPIWSSLPGQLIAKLSVTAAVVAVVVIVRAVLRDSVRAEGA